MSTTELSNQKFPFSTVAEPFAERLARCSERMMAAWDLFAESLAEGNQPKTRRARFEIDGAAADIAALRQERNQLAERNSHVLS